jgi:hypothetical protein
MRQETQRLLSDVRVFFIFKFVFTLTIYHATKRFVYLFNIKSIIYTKNSILLLINLL